MDYKTVVRRYYEFSKPGIVYANILTAAAGYLFASHFHLHILVLTGLLVGLSVLIIGACATNNVIDRKRDAQMERTAKRGLVTGEIPLGHAISYALLASVAGLIILTLTQNRLTFGLSFLAYIDYVLFYGIAKRYSVHGTLVGCVSGSIPLVAGYTAVIGHLTLTAWLLFAIMVSWQMAHFYGIALFRLNDYANAKLPVMPVRYGIATTKLQVIAYMIVFVLLALALSGLGEQGWFGTLALAAAGCMWLYRALKNYQKLSSGTWGKQVFLHSLVVMLVLVGSLALGPLLP